MRRSTFGACVGGSPLGWDSTGRVPDRRVAGAVVGGRE